METKRTVNIGDLTLDTGLMSRLVKDKNNLLNYIKDNEQKSSHKSLFKLLVFYSKYVDAMIESGEKFFSPRDFMQLVREVYGWNDLSAWFSDVTLVGGQYNFYRHDEEWNSCTNFLLGEFAVKRLKTTEVISCPHSLRAVFCTDAVDPLLPAIDVLVRAPVVIHHALNGHPSLRAVMWYLSSWLKKLVRTESIYKKRHVVFARVFNQCRVKFGYTATALALCGVVSESHLSYHKLPAEMAYVLSVASAAKSQAALYKDYDYGLELVIPSVLRVEKHQGHLLELTKEMLMDMVGMLDDIIPSIKNDFDDLDELDDLVLHYGFAQLCIRCDPRIRDEIATLIGKVQADVETPIYMKNFLGEIKDNM